MNKISLCLVIVGIDSYVDKSVHIVLMRFTGKRESVGDTTIKVNE